MNTDKGGLWIIDETSDLDAGLAEVEQQTKRKPRRPEIIDALGIMSVVQYSSRFQLHHNVGLNEQINRILHPFLAHNDPKLPLDHQSRFGQFKRRCVFKNLLQKPDTERIADPKRAPNDAFRVSIDSEIIRVHQRTSVAKIPCVAAPATGPAEAVPIVANIR